MSAPAEVTVGAQRTLLPEHIGRGTLSGLRSVKVVATKYNNRNATVPLSRQTTSCKFHGTFQLRGTSHIQWHQEINVSGHKSLLLVS
jgi:hypothetical protein